MPTAQTDLAPDSWASLDAEIDVFMREQALATSTRSNRALSWGRWERFCRVRGYEPLGAPYEAYAAVFAVAWEGPIDPAPRRKRTRNAGPLTKETLDNLFTAVANAHLQAGLVAAHQRPEHAGNFQLLRRGYARQLAELGVSRKQAKALRGAEVRDLVAVEPPWEPQSLTRAALMLVSLDLGWGADQVSTLSPAHVSQVDGGAKVADPATGDELFLPCSCDTTTGRQMTDAVPATCTACLLLAAADAAPDDDFSLLTQVHGRVATARESWQRRTKAAAASWRHIEVSADGGLVYAGHRDDVWATRGTRLGLIEAQREGLLYRAGQARLVASWRVAWRSRDEPSRLLRRHLKIKEEAPGEVSVTVFLPASKTDQRKEGVKFEVASGPINPGTVRILQWAAVVDAMQDSGPGTPLFCSWRRHDHIRATEALGRSEWGKHLHALQAAAGLSGFTPHSTRVGFGVTAVEQGYDEFAIQDTMRLRTPELVHRYSHQARHSKAPLISLVDGLTKAITEPAREGVEK